MHRKDELIHLISDEIVNSEDLQDMDWKEATIIFDVGMGSVSNSGFAYLTEKTIPICASGFKVDEYVRALRDELKLANKQCFVQLLVQIRRSDGKISADFEYKNHLRWRIGPANLAVMREVLRPKWEG